MPILLLRVEAEGGKDDCCYLDLEHVRTTDSLLQNVHQLAWDLLPGACRIQATYADDEGDQCTLTEQTAKDALSFARPHEGIDDTVLLTVIVHGVWAQEGAGTAPSSSTTEVEAPEMCQAGCGKPTWNKAPGFCGSKCQAAGPLVHQAKATASEMCQGGCGKPTWNGAFGFCGTKCKAEAEERHREDVQAAADHAAVAKAVDADAGRQAVSEEHQNSERSSHDMKQKMEALGEELAEAMCQREQLRQQCDLFKVQLATAEEQVGSATASGDDARDKLAKLTVEVDELKGQQAHVDQQSSDQIETLKHKVQELEEGQAQNKDQRDDLKRELAQLQKQYEDEIAAMRDAAAAPGGVVLEEVQDALAQRSSELEASRQQCKRLKDQLATAESNLESAAVSQQTTQERSEKNAAELDEVRQQLALEKQQGVIATEALQQKLKEIEVLTTELGERKAYCSDLERQLEEIEKRHEEDSKAWVDAAAEAQSKLAVAEAQSAERAQALQEMEQTLSTLREGRAAEVEDAKNKLEEVRQHHKEQVREIQQVGAADLQKIEEQREQFRRQLAEAEKQHGDVCARWSEEVKTKTAAAAASGQVAQQLTEDLHDMQRQLKSAQQVCEERAQALQDRAKQLQQAECNAEAARSSLDALKSTRSTPNYSASVLLLKDSPLTLGIEAEEDDSARGDVTKELGDMVASYGARAAFRIGRMRLPATFSEVAPACARVAVRNDGPSRWPPTTVIVNVEGDSLGLQVMALGVLEPGEVREIEMDLEVGSKSDASQKRIYRPRHAMPQLAPRFVHGEPRAEIRSLWAILDAATGERLGPLLVFEAVWDLS